VKPRIETLPEKKLMGKHLTMSLSHNRTYELWHSFMVKIKTIKNRLSTDLYSIQVFDDSLDFKNFSPNTIFEKWAAAEVENFDEIPDDMECYTLSGGLYAVFIHKGPASAFQKTFEFIFNDWLPKSEYTLDKKEHFELLGDQYKNNDPDSEEEIWIPIKLKNKR
jgi:AraC family transcriptional regulator